MNQVTENFKIKFVQPFSTFAEGEPTPIPYIIDGLLPQGGFSILAGKPKLGKTSLSRSEAVCVAKGVPFLGRESVQGDVILISLEDSRRHTDNCLKGLGYDPGNDAKIQMVERVAPKLEDTINELAEELAKMPNVRLVIIDTLAKLLRVNDLNEYMPTLRAVEQLRNLARHFPLLHIQALAHCKKVATDDVFDSMLGSTALRGETDSNLALYQDSGHRVIVTETRTGRDIPATVLNAELVESAGAHIVRNFSLGPTIEKWKSEKSVKTEKRKAASHEERIINYLSGTPNQSATQKAVLDNVIGNTQQVLDAIHRMMDHCVLVKSGTAHSLTDPLTFTLNPNVPPMTNFMMSEFGNGLPN